MRGGYLEGIGSLSMGNDIGVGAGAGAGALGPGR